jgi:hypothetical protein
MRKLASAVAALMLFGVPDVRAADHLQRFYDGNQLFEYCAKRGSPSFDEGQCVGFIVGVSDTLAIVPFTGKISPLSLPETTSDSIGGAGHRGWVLQ